MTTPPETPGKYDAACTVARESCKARGVVLIVIDGAEGHGFSVQVPPELRLHIPELLNRVACDIIASS